MYLDELYVSWWQQDGVTGRAAAGGPSGELNAKADNLIFVRARVVPS